MGKGKQQDPFQQRRDGILTALATNCGDKSRKGSVDVRALGVINIINARSDMYTTSSCSGRISVFAEPTAVTRAGGKKGGEWVYASHDPAVEAEVMEAVHAATPSGGKLVFRFEPFLLHAECVDMVAAGWLLHAAVLAGFRESGATMGANWSRIIAGVRCSLRLEVPIADEGRMLVDDTYLKYLIAFANEKFDINTTRIRKLEQLLASGAAQHPAIGVPAAGSSEAEGMGMCGGGAVAAGAPPSGGPGARRGKAARQGDPMAPFVSIKARQVDILKRVAALEQATGGRVVKEQKDQGSRGPAPPTYSAKPKKAMGSGPAGKQAASGTDKPQEQGGKRKGISDEGVLVGGQHGSKRQKQPANGPYQAPAGSTKGGVKGGAKKGARPATSSAQAAVAAAATDAAAGAPQSLQLSEFPVAGQHMSGPHWRTLPMDGLQSMSHGDLLRWGHASVAWRGKLVVIGGYGGEGTHTRRADVLLYDPTAAAVGGTAGGHGAWRTAETQGAAQPCPRMGHAATLLGDYAVVVGGRTSPSHPLADVWALHLPTLTWHAVRVRIMRAPGSSAAQPTAGGGTAPAAGGVSGDDAVQVGGWPGRYRHSAVADNTPRVGVDGVPRIMSIVVFGGRNDVEMLGDTWVLQAPCAAANQPDPSVEWTWVEVPAPPEPATTTSTAPTTASTGSTPATANAGGGDTAAGVSSAPAASALAAPVGWPCARKSHAAAVLAGKMYLHGGATAYGQHLDDLYCLEFTMLHAYLQACYGPGRSYTTDSAEGAVVREKTKAQAQAWLWKALKPGTGGAVPPACFSHTLSAWGAHKLILAGGYPTHHHSSVYVYETRIGAQGTWTRVPVAVPPIEPGITFVPVRHCAEVLPGATTSPGAQPSVQLVLVGGGAFCFSFGSTFSRVYSLGLAAVEELLPGGIPRTASAWTLAAGPAPAPGIIQPSEASASDKAGPRAVAAASSTTSAAVPSSAPPAAAQGASSGWVLAVQARRAKPVKDALKAIAWLDCGKKAGEMSRLQQQGQMGGSLTAASGAAPTAAMVLLPLTAAAMGPLLEAAQALSQPDASVPSQLPAAVADALKDGVASLSQAVTAANPKQPVSPQQAMAAAVRALLPATLDSATVDQLLADLPVKWERLGDLALIPEHACTHVAWATALPGGLPDLWQAVAGAMGMARLARQAAVANTGTRDSQAVMLLGADGWVQHREGGVTFELDVTRCMYSSGNVTERARMGSLAAEGEVVVDLFTGIGYYTLPLLVNAHVAKVYACEWNPHAIEGLKRGLSANKVADRCEVRQGDCSQVAPQGVADRVSLGLLPSSECGWAAAVAALKPTGGVLHVHNNVLDSEEAAWAAAAVAKLQELCRALPGRSGWHSALHHIERVKWYAPRVRHVVLDVELRPHPIEAQPSAPSTKSVVPAKGSVSKHAKTVDDKDGKAGKGGGIGALVADASSAPTPGQASSRAVVHSTADESKKAGLLQGLLRGVRNLFSDKPAKASNSQAVTEDVDGSELACKLAVHAPCAGSRLASLDTELWFQRPWDSLPRVRELKGVDRSVFDCQVSPAREPVVLKGLDIGPCVERWDAAYLMSTHGAADTQVAVHVVQGAHGALDFCGKNFKYCTTSFAQLVGRVSGKGGPYAPLLPTTPTASGNPNTALGPEAPAMERYYLRSLGSNPRKEPARLSATFPQLSADVALPQLFEPDVLHSSVLRISSPGLRLWTHYDIMDNVLVQVRGVKRVLLWHPLHLDNLYTQASSSPITDIFNPDLNKYPKYVHAVPVVCTLTPGDVLFIPALWHHNVLTVSDGHDASDSSTRGAGAAVQGQYGGPPGDGWSVSVNAFWRNLPQQLYERKDLYGNRDLAPANIADEAAGAVAKHLAQLPEPYKSFYGARVISRLREDLQLQEQQPGVSGYSGALA